MALNNKQYIISRYAFVSVIILGFSIWILGFLIRNTIVNAQEWNEVAQKELDTYDTIAPERGNIIASNGNILACNLKALNVMVDFRDKRIGAKFRAIPWNLVDALADSLDKYYPRREDLHRSKDFYAQHSWRTRLHKELSKDARKRPMALVLAKKVTAEDFQRIRNFPFLNEFIDKDKPNKRTIVFSQGCNVRVYPYGKMATRSIGRVSQVDIGSRTEIHGYSGLEKCLDSLLYGQPGLAQKTAMNSGMRNWVVKAPQRGYDVLSTIDIDMQDMLEEQLNNVCMEANAIWGTAVLMEVSTGEIKAISNLEFDPETGTYIEALNRAVEAVEPGSVMKPISLMIAFEDGVITSPNSTVDCSPFMRTSDHAGGGIKTMRQVIETSSNTGIARVIFRKYSQNPELFYDRLKGIGFFETMNSGIADESKPRMRRLTEIGEDGRRWTMEARHLDLARQAYGYSTAIPPLYTLSIYNAIANDGRYVRPHLVRGYRLADGRDSILNVPPIRERICSPKTAQMVRECIHDVVWGDHGTARGVRDDRIKVVGKTGTAYPYDWKVLKAYDTSKRRFAFCGFFPYENPKYSCIALILAPGGNSANRTSGQVVKNMALKMYARGMLDNSSRFTDQRTDSSPVLIAGTSTDAGDLTAALKLNSVKRLKAPQQGAPNTLPDVCGYDAPSALRTLEKKGYKVIMHGQGHVVSQQPAAGSQLKHGDKVTLNLKI